MPLLFTGSNPFIIRRTRHAGSISRRLDAIRTSGPVRLDYCADTCFRHETCLNSEDSSFYYQYLLYTVSYRNGMCHGNKKGHILMQSRAYMKVLNIYHTITKSRFILLQ